MHIGARSRSFAASAARLGHRLLARSCRRLRAVATADALLEHLTPLSVDAFVEELRRELEGGAEAQTRSGLYSVPLVESDP